MTPVDIAHDAQRKQLLHKSTSSLANLDNVPLDLAAFTSALEQTGVDSGKPQSRPAPILEITEYRLTVLIAFITFLFIVTMMNFLIELMEDVTFLKDC